MSCACGISPQSPGSFEWSAPVSASGRKSFDDGLVDELRLLSFQALSGPSAPVVSLLPVCPTRNLARDLHLMSSRSCTCVVDRDCIKCSGASAVRNLVSFSTRCTSLCVRHIVRSCCRSAQSRSGCTLHPLWVCSSQSAVGTALLSCFSPAVGPICTLADSIMHRVVHDLGI